jgi:hypothetical protein
MNTATGECSLWILRQNAGKEFYSTFGKNGLWS